MKKKILGIILFAIMFLPAISVSALTCEYTKEVNGTETKYKVEINSPASVIVYKNGTRVSEDIKINIFDIKNIKECPKDENVTISEVAKTISIRSKVSCGNVDEIPEKIPELTSFAITIIQIAIPIVLILMGSIDLFKGITANKEDEIKKGQQMFIKRLIYAAVIFFIVVIVKFLISIIADSTTSGNIVECIDCFLSGTENCRR